MIYAQPNNSPGEWHTQSPLGLWHTNRSPNLIQTTRPSNNQQKKKKKEKKRKKRTCKIVDFAVPANHRVKLKESEKKDKYLNLARELNKLWNIKVIFILIAIGILGTVTKGLIKGGLGNKRTSGDYQNYCIIKNGQNTEKSPGDLRRFAVS